MTKSNTRVPSIRDALAHLMDIAGENTVWEESFAASIGPGDKEPYDYSNLSEQLVSLGKSKKPLSVALNPGDEQGDASVIGIFGGHESGLHNARVMIMTGKMLDAALIDLRGVRNVLRGLAADAADVVQEIEEMKSIPPELEEMQAMLAIIAERLEEVS